MIGPVGANLTWTRLLRHGAEAVLAVTGLPYLSDVYLALAGIVIIDTFRSVLTHDLDERHGAVICALWQAQTIPKSEDDLLVAANEDLQRLGKARMKKRELRDVLTLLSELGCVKPTPKGWLLRDRVWFAA